MTLDLEKYTWTDGQTALSAAELNARFYAIVRRLHALEQLSIDWSSSISEVQNYGLARINDAVQPLIDGLKVDLTNLIAQGTADLASQSAAVDAKLTDVDTRMASVESIINAAAANLATHAARTDNPHKVTLAQLGAEDPAGNILPGSVIAFSGTFGGADNRHPIPRGGTEPNTGWLLCDGGDDGAGGTVPDLRGRMILGASDAHPAGSTGGAETHTHSVSGSVGATTLTESQMPSHHHNIHSKTDTGPTIPSVFMSSGEDLSTRDLVTQYTGGSLAHNHSFSGLVDAAYNLPPYYAMAYIIKL